MPSGRYAICHHPRTYQEAKIGCTSLGASLVVVDSEEEKSHIGTIWSAFNLGFDSSYWIGLSKLTENGTWLWVNGTPVDYTAWDSGQPSNNPDETCVATSLASRNAWYGYPCDTEIMFLCEFTPPPTQEAPTAFQAGLNPPDDLKGTWYLSSESLTAYPAFQAAPLGEHQPTLAFVDALDLKLSFGATAF